MDHETSNAGAGAGSASKSQPLIYKELPPPILEFTPPPGALDVPKSLPDYIQKIRDASHTMEDILPAHKRTERMKECAWYQTLWEGRIALSNSDIVVFHNYLAQQVVALAKQYESWPSSTNVSALAALQLMLALSALPFETKDLPSLRPLCVYLRSILTKEGVLSHIITQRKTISPIMHTYMRIDMANISIEYFNAPMLEPFGYSRLALMYILQHRVLTQELAHILEHIIDTIPDNKELLARLTLVEPDNPDTRLDKGLLNLYYERIRMEDHEEQRATSVNFIITNSTIRKYLHDFTIDKLVIQRLYLQYQQAILLGEDFKKLHNDLARDIASGVPGATDMLKSLAESMVVFFSKAGTDKPLDNPGELYLASQSLLSLHNYLVIFELFLEHCIPEEGTTKQMRDIVVYLQTIALKRQAQLLLGEDSVTEHAKRLDTQYFQQCIDERRTDELFLFMNQFIDTDGVIKPGIAYLFNILSSLTVADTCFLVLSKLHPNLRDLLIIHIQKQIDLIIAAPPAMQESLVKSLNTIHPIYKVTPVQHAACCNFGSLFTLLHRTLRHFDKTISDGSPLSPLISGREHPVIMAAFFYQETDIITRFLDEEPTTDFAWLTTLLFPSAASRHSNQSFFYQLWKIIKDKPLLRTPFIQRVVPLIVKTIVNGHIEKAYLIDKKFITPLGMTDKIIPDAGFQVELLIEIVIEIVLFLHEIKKDNLFPEPSLLGLKLGLKTLLKDIGFYGLFKGIILSGHTDLLEISDKSRVKALLLDSTQCGLLSTALLKNHTTDIKALAHLKKVVDTLFPYESDKRLIWDKFFNLHTDAPTNALLLIEEYWVSKGETQEKILEKLVWMSQLLSYFNAETSRGILEIILPKIGAARLLINNDLSASEHLYAHFLEPALKKETTKEAAIEQGLSWISEALLSPDILPGINQAITFLAERIAVFSMERVASFYTAHKKMMDPLLTMGSPLMVFEEEKKSAKTSHKKGKKTKSTKKDGIFELSPQLFSLISDAVGKELTKSIPENDTDISLFIQTVYQQLISHRLWPTDIVTDSGALLVQEEIGRKLEEKCEEKKARAQKTLLSAPKKRTSGFFAAPSISASAHDRPVVPIWSRWLAKKPSDEALAADKKTFYDKLAETIKSNVADIPFSFNELITSSRMDETEIDPFFTLINPFYTFPSHECSVRINGSDVGIAFLAYLNRTIFGQENRLEPSRDIDVQVIVNKTRVQEARLAAIHASLPYEGGASTKIEPEYLHIGFDAKPSLRPVDLSIAEKRQSPYLNLADGSLEIPISPESTTRDCKSLRLNCLFLNRILKTLYYNEALGQYFVKPNYLDKTFLVNDRFSPKEFALALKVIGKYHAAGFITLEIDWISPLFDTAEKKIIFKQVIHKETIPSSPRFLSASKSPRAIALLEIYQFACAHGLIADPAIEEFSKSSAFK